MRIKARRLLPRKKSSPSNNDKDSCSLLFSPQHVNLWRRRCAASHRFLLLLLLHFCRHYSEYSNRSLQPTVWCCYCFDAADFFHMLFDRVPPVQYEKLHRHYLLVFVDHHIFVDDVPIPIPPVLAVAVFLLQRIVHFCSNTLSLVRVRFSDIIVLLNSNNDKDLSITMWSNSCSVSTTFIFCHTNSSNNNENNLICLSFYMLLNDDIDI